MAVFIQKLFKSRKSREANEPTQNKAAPAAAPKEDSRDTLRAQQLQILTGTPDETTLSELAIDGVTADIRLDAACRLKDPELLHQVQKQSKGRDKGVYQTVKQALHQIREEQARQEALSRTITSLITSASDQARSEDTKLYEARLETLLRQWSEVENHATPAQVQSFLEAVHLCRERLAAIQEEARQEQRRQEQKHQRSETLALLTETLNELGAHPLSELSSLATLDALQKTQENRWQEASRDTEVDKKEQQAYESSMSSLKSCVDAIRRITQEQASIEALASSAKAAEEVTEELREQARALLKTISWPEKFPVPELLQPLRKLANSRPRAVTPPPSESEEQQKQLATSLKSTMDRLEAALEEKKLKESKQLLKAAQQQLKGLDHRHSKPFQARMQLLTGQVRELSDWQGFATAPKQIALCEQMEYLATQPMDPEAKAERIKELQVEWRELGGSSDRLLWARFKEASDKAYEPCKEYFAAKSGLKQANLQKREAICDELENFLTQADWQAMNWKVAEKIHLTARQEWKAAWPVEFRDNRRVQKRFDDLLKKLEGPLDQERQKNEALKQEIVDRANALIDHEPLQEAMNLAKNLQAEWKAIGITRHREDRKLWQAFRKACDEIFARRDSQRNEQQEATRAADAQAGAILQETAALGPDSAPDALTEAVARLQALDTSTLSAARKQEVQSDIQRLRKVLDGQRLQQNISTWQSLIMARAESQVSPDQLPEHWSKLVSDLQTADPQELVIRAEILGEVESPESDRQRRMEIQVQRLAQGMGAQEKTGDRLSELEKLVANWCLKTPDEALNKALAERLTRVLGAVTAA